MLNQHPAGKRSRLACLFFAALCLAGAALGCKEQRESDGEPVSAESMPSLDFVVDSKVLYTWVKADGSFQLSEKVEEIPAAAREHVRVVAHDKPPGSPIHVFVADLRAAKAGDQAKASPLERHVWEARGQDLRKAKVAPLEKQAQADAPAPVMANGKSAIVYGADWCGPCHQAEDYLKKRGLSVTKKNIEDDPAAVSEMRAKLQTAGLGPSTAIPILDVAGTMMIGFSPAAIDAALRSAKN